MEKKVLVKLIASFFTHRSSFINY